MVRPADIMCSFGSMFAQPALDHFRRDRERQHGVVALTSTRGVDAEFLQRMHQAVPVEVGVPLRSGRNTG
jgi:hypothetical protein